MPVKFFPDANIKFTLGSEWGAEVYIRDENSLYASTHVLQWPHTCCIVAHAIENIKYYKWKTQRRWITMEKMTDITSRPIVI